MTKNVEIDEIFAKMTELWLPKNDLYVTPLQKGRFGDMTYTFGQIRPLEGDFS